MNMLAVVTEDFAFYHDMVRKLKRRGVSFVSLGLDDPIPPMVGAVLTTTAEEAVVDFSCVFPVERGPDVVGKGHTDVEVEAEVDGGSDERLEMALDRALAHLLGKGRIELLVVGVDPGKRPGLAVMGDAVLLKTMQVGSPEDVGEALAGVISTYEPTGTLVRLGDGAPTQRDRILNGLSDMAGSSGGRLRLEVVDEARSSDGPHRSDTGAAIKIALTHGRTVSGERAVVPTEGELKELQRRSRVASGGEVTISRELAVRVALGEMDMAEAIEAQRSGA